jgi:hypothetical protein
MPRTALLAAALLAACAPADEARVPLAAGSPPAASAPPVVVPARDSAGARRVFYVPVYSHIYHRDQHRFIDLAVTLSIRNTDPAHPVTLASVHYYDTKGGGCAATSPRRGGWAPWPPPSSWWRTATARAAPAPTSWWSSMPPAAPPTPCWRR